MHRPEPVSYTILTQYYIVSKQKFHAVDIARKTRVKNIVKQTDLWMAVVTPRVVFVFLALSVEHVKKFQKNLQNTLKINLIILLIFY